MQTLNGKLMEPTAFAVGGHRGMGANILRQNAVHPPWRENTTGSFLAAAATGASFVEFDVQVTADGVPVLWHDDTVDFGDPSAPSRAPVADLTLAEFKALGSITSAAGAAATRLAVVRSFWEELELDAAAAAAAAAGGVSTPPPSPPRAAAPPRSPPRSPVPRGRSPHRHWRCARDEGFPTLKEVFSALPPGVGFDIEVKMATPDTLAVTPPEEVERVIAPILAAVERCCPPPAAGGAAAPHERPVVFSSFDPDVCRELRARQSRWPVLFLSTGGVDAHADARRTSLAAALEVAVGYGLCGLILDSGALQANPGFVSAVAAAGRELRVYTYGQQNDDPEWVLQQAALGVHGVICDDVPAALAALAAPPAPAAEALAAPSMLPPLPPATRVAA
ncbi:MAG: PLC-like phosphodiesterase [Monoraphidium minutum]|nr:MAG: PLC-like phosphodiesterase [Monoraphidium minutum]